MMPRLSAGSAKRLTPVMPGGMNWLGFMYANGRGGLPKDDAQAVSWFRKAADAGHAGRHELAGLHVRERPRRLAQG
jgi:TPR repeat protein